LLDAENDELFFTKEHDLPFPDEELLQCMQEMDFLTWHLFGEFVDEERRIEEVGLRE